MTEKKAAEQIQKRENKTELYLEWDNKILRHDKVLFWFLVIFWIVWVPLTVIGTTMIFISNSPVFSSIWCIFGWLGTLLIPYAVLQRSWVEWISISPERIICGQDGAYLHQSQKPSFVVRFMKSA